MFITHPRLATAYALGVFGLVTAHSVIAHLHESNMLDMKHSVAKLEFMQVVRYHVIDTKHLLKTNAK